jgi:hypothetical protein
LSTDSRIAELVLATTMDMTSGREAEVARLIESVERFRTRRPGVPLRHHLLLQQCPDAHTGAERIGAPSWMTVSAAPGRLSLSAARNRMLDVLLAEGIDADALVGFPDDDAWYPDGILEHVLDRFSGDPGLDFWFCRYGTAARFEPDHAEQAPSLQQVLSYASSNTVLIRGRVIDAIGGFDERLGLGTPAGSGEDTEFALRAYFAARRTRYTRAMMIGHRDYTAGFRARYFAGALVAIARHSRRSPAAMKALVRKLAVGAALVLRGEMKPGQLRAAIAMIRADRRARAAA